MRSHSSRNSHLVVSPPPDPATEGCRRTVNHDKYIAKISFFTKPMPVSLNQKYKGSRGAALKLIPAFKSMSFYQSNYRSTCNWQSHPQDRLAYRHFFDSPHNTFYLNVNEIKGKWLAIPLARAYIPLDGSLTNCRRLSPPGLVFMQANLACIISRICIYTENAIMHKILAMISD